MHLYLHDAVIRITIVVVAKGNILFTPPHQLFHTWIVNERVPVLLDTPHCLVTVQFLLTDRIFGRPSQQHLHSPIAQSGIHIPSQHRTVPAGDTFMVTISIHIALVAGHHIEIRPREIPLILIGRLKHGPIVAQSVAGWSQFGESSLGAVGRSIRLSKRLIPPFVVDPAICRIHVM